MPLTVVSKTAEFDAATFDEVTTLLATFEAATEAHAAVKAATPEVRGAHRYDSPEREAYTAALAPTAETLRLANTRLSACRSLPVGTVVRFSTSAGWSGNEYDSGRIVQVTDSSYVVEKEFGRSKARLDRENAHEYQSSYSGTRGARSLSVMRTPSQDRVHRAQVAQQAAVAQQEREAYQAQVRAVQARQDALKAQHGVLHDARSRAIALLAQRHAEELARLEHDLLDALSLDAPGRAETAPIETA